MKMRPKNRTVALLALSSLLFTPACGGEESADDTKKETDAGTTKTPTKGFGQGCKSSSDCKDGMVCMQSEYTPTPFCTRFCDSPKDYCDQDKLGGINALCLQMPGVWVGPTKKECDANNKCDKVGRPFCAPICSNTATCTAIWSSWELCTKPAYKNVKLYSDLPTQVCMAPSSHGQRVVDPLTCDWEKKVTDPDVQEAKQLCKAHCDFLTKCQLFDPKKEAASCCTWRCFQKMTPEGKINQERKALIKCYIKSFSANRGTPQVCTKYKADCGELAEPRG